MTASTARAGAAAGAAAALAAARGKGPHEVPWADVREALEKGGTR